MHAVGLPERLASMLHLRSIWQMLILPPRATRDRVSRAEIFSPTNSPIFLRAEIGAPAKHPKPLIDDRRIMRVADSRCTGFFTKVFRTIVSFDREPVTR